MEHPLWSPTLRPFFYFSVTISIMALLSLGWAVFPADFIWLYFVAYFVLIFSCAFTAAWGLAEYAQARYDERKFRKTVERELIK